MYTQNKFKKKIKEELDKEVWGWGEDVAKERNCIDVGRRGGDLITYPVIREFSFVF